MKQLLKILFTGAIAMVISANAFSQDLIASQAPIDKKIRSIDSLAMQKQIQAEQNEFPGLDIYPEWTNDYVNYSNAKIPDSYVIDLTGFYMPTPSTKITDVFGYRPRRRRSHAGLDIKVQTGDTIRAAFDGKVRVVQDQGRSGYGKYIVIRHDNGLETVYGHLSKHLVKADQLVRAGDVIGLGGSTGRSTGSHLHFETRFLGIAINPALMFDFEKQDIVADTYTFYKNKTVERTAKKAATGSNNANAMASTDAVYYKVKSGDSLSKIADMQGITIDQLCKLNNLTRKYVLRPGQMIRCS
jgi:murein DD-endopeptidase MepM/ murein hydrolase activator NlpD